uniref:Uncharacterized protein n=1 Tax=Mesocestoides corti TaxID=53468 RepID=A0A5K3FZ77_MESCO
MWLHAHTHEIECTAGYLSPNRKKSGTAEQSLLTNHNPKPHVSSRPSESPRWPRHSFYIAPHSYPSLVGCLASSNAIGTQRDEDQLSLICLVLIHWSTTTLPPPLDLSCPQLLIWFTALFLIVKISSLTHTSPTSGSNRCRETLLL